MKTDNTKRKIQFSPPDMSELEISMVADALHSGWITTGPRVKELEKEIADYVSSSRAVCLNSETACAESALRLLGIGALAPGLDGVYGSENDEVITCVYTYTASASVVCHTGAKLRLVDCLPDSPTIDYDALENAINENTKAIIPIDIAGVPCDYDRIFEIVNRKKSLFRPSNRLQEAIGRVAVISDAAHALGSEAMFKGKNVRVGSISDFSCFSFHAVKNLTTAEGGALTWNSFSGIDDDEIYKRVQLFSLHGQNKDAFSKNRLGSWEYDVIGTWYKCNMTDIMGAIGLAQLQRYDEMLARRREIVSRYDEAFKPQGIRVLSHLSPEHTSCCHLYLTYLPGLTREETNGIIEQMAQRGISVNVHYKPLPLLTAYRNMGFDIASYPNAAGLYENEITLPLHTILSDEDVEYIISNYIELASKR